MSYFLGVDTGGTYTDAVIVEQEADSVISSAKSLTTRSDLSLGIGRAVNKALEDAQIKVNDISMVSLSTTLATNALVEGQGGRVALIFIGFDAVDLERAGLDKAWEEIQ
jgi:N-methylhydantoinase A/oxoprolinase/acetone carboxylase beta subunit